MFKFLFKWGFIIVVAIVLWNTITGTFQQIYWWMYP